MLQLMTRQICILTSRNVTHCAHPCAKKMQYAATLCKRAVINAEEAPAKPARTWLAAASGPCPMFSLFPFWTSMILVMCHNIISPVELSQGFLRSSPTANCESDVTYTARSVTAQLSSAQQCLHDVSRWKMGCWGHFPFSYHLPLTPHRPPLHLKLSLSSFHISTDRDPP